MVNTDLLAIVMPALAVGIMIALTHAPLGLEVLRRGIIFMDLAIAQFAGLGGILLSAENTPPLLAQAGTLGFALLGALFFRWVEKVLPQHQEAVIGSAFVGAASLSLLLLANHPHGGEEIQRMLSGQMLFVTWVDILHHLPVYALVLACWFGSSKARKGITFYALFALAITSSVQLVGVYVVFASLVLPALAVIHKKKRETLWAWGCGLISVSSGLVASTLMDTPSGPTVVLAYMGVAVLTLTLRRKKQKRAATG